MKSFKMTLSVALATILVNAVSARAVEVFESKGTGGVWNNAGSWQWISGPGAHTNYPQAGDVATILSGDTVYVDNSATAVAGEIEVQSTGILELQNAAVLEVADVLTIDGTFQFNDQTEGTRPILRATADLVIDGNISTVSGADDGGKIEVANLSINTVELVSGSMISCQYGPVEIACFFKNDGVVRANGSANGFDILFNSSCILSDDSVGKFEVTAAGSKMIFDHNVTAVPDLAGADFNVEAGLMYFKKSLMTDGGFRQIAGVVKADPATTFSAIGAY